MNVRTVTIIGGGVIGITTALYLKRLGYQTELITHLRADRLITSDSLPEFASLYPPACIAPHSVEMSDVDQIFEASQVAFARLAGTMGNTIRWQQHYELFAEGNDEPPGYVKHLRNYRPYGGSRRHLHFDNAVNRDLHGWVADYLFVETPAYLPYLYREYLMLCGDISTSQLEPDDICRLKSDVIVNCTGLWARELFNDFNLYPIRGHLMLLENAPFPIRPDGLLFSYNYTPPKEEYPYDVYFFPRSGACPPGQRGWVLGGSREAPEQSGGELWRSPEARYEHYEGIPEPIFGLNRKIIRTLTGGIDISDFSRRTFMGYRPARRGGVRLELVEEFGKPIIHNYGHGGAGVTLSWGCAERVARIIAYA